MTKHDPVSQAIQLYDDAHAADAWVLYDEPPAPSASECIIRALNMAFPEV